ncbi:MAG: tyrosine-type recombinase/integrase [Candidatus Dormibacteraeota bacterium]|nr:tyrosine-type recombinase/integrase [Candidatus Dormibacteraeota bacterium]
MSGLGQAVDEYLAIRRTMGFKLQDYDRLLGDFVDYLERCGAGTITIQAAVSWATAPAVSQSYQADRLCAVRGFARYVKGTDPSVEVPPVGLLARRGQRRIPYLFSTADKTGLVEAASRLEPVLRGATYEALFGLVATTGMRIGETIRLERSDVDLHGGVLEINDTKFRKHRRIPLHDSAVAALGRYVEVRDQLCPKPKASSFFISTRGTRLLYVCINEVFRKLVDDIGLTQQSPAGRPRIHDLRHNFAIATLVECYRSGTDPQATLPVLSAYLGHADPIYTYWYLQACPELLGLAAEGLERWEEGQR